MLPEDRKLTITYRVEPGTLGPDGASHIEAFCQFLTERLQGFYPEVIQLKVVPRYDKQRPEKQFSIANKQISLTQATVYLDTLALDIDQIDDELDEQTSQLVDDFFQQTMP